jgi:adenosylcobinamide-phosphate guanylyltransferase
LIAAVMCGGAGQRLEANIEKPLITVGGIPIVERVIRAILGSQKFEKCAAAVSPKTPATKAFLETRGVKIIETPGKGYSQDLSMTLDELRPSKVLVISADMPLVSAHTIGEIASKPLTKKLLSVVLTKEFVDSLGITPSFTFWRNGVQYCRSGISIFDNSKHTEGEIEEEYLVVDKIQVAVNVNTKKDLELAEKLLVQHV